MKSFLTLVPNLQAMNGKKSAKSYGFSIVCSSALYHQSNGEVEHAVKTVKKLLFKYPDNSSLALLTYRATPNASGFSPSELLMGRCLRTRLPMLPDQLKSQVIHEDNFYSQDRIYRDKQKENYDKRHIKSSLRKKN